MASSMGIFVYKDITSNLTSLSSSLSFSVEISSTQVAEYLPKDLVFPTKGLSKFSIYLANLYVGDPIVLTIGLSRAPCICIFRIP